MIQPEINKKFTHQQIAKFVLDNDMDNIFASARINRYQFEEVILRLNAYEQVITFDNNGELWGVLGWYFVTDENKHEATKAVWRLPDKCTCGDILYLSFIATKGDCDVLAIKNMFENMGYRNKITRRRGYTKGRFYEKRIFKKEITQGDRNATATADELRVTSPIEVS